MEIEILEKYITRMIIYWVELFCKKKKKKMILLKYLEKMNSSKNKKTKEKKMSLRVFVWKSKTIGWSGREGNGCLMRNGSSGSDLTAEVSVTRAAANWRSKSEEPQTNNRHQIASCFNHRMHFASFASKESSTLSITERSLSL